MTNSGVNIAVGTPIMWYAEAEYQSRFGNIFFSSHISFSIFSDTSNRRGLPPSVQSLRDISLMISLRGSDTVYTGCPKPMMISLRSTRARMSASASAALR